MTESLELRLASPAIADIGHVRMVVAGPAGTLVAGTTGIARENGGAWKREATPCASSDWIAREEDFLTIENDGTGVVIDARGERRKIPGKKPDTHVELGATQSAWDPERGALVRFGGTVRGEKFSDDTREWRDGAWRDVATKTRPAARTKAAMTYVPPLAGIVMVGGWATDHLADTALFDGREWTVWDAPMPAEATQNTPGVLFFDAISKQLVQSRIVDAPRGREIALWRFVGEGRWQLAGKLSALADVENDDRWLSRVLSLGWSFDPKARAIVAAGTHQGLVVGRAELGPWLDALEPVGWSPSA